MTTVTLTREQYKAFASGKALVEYLKARGISDPESATQSTNDETGEVSFTDG